jgi:lactate permease
VYNQVFDPVGDSLGLTSIFAVLPLVTLFILLGVLRWRAHWAGLASLGVALLVAMIAYSMPVDQALLAASEGATFGLWPIMWIVVTAIWIFKMTEKTGYFEVLRRAFARISDDQRIQVIIIAFCFGALLEALAGFGTPVAITATMMIAMGFQPMKAAAAALVANTAPVAFGAIAVPIITLASITELPKEELGAMAGRQTPILALFVPLGLVALVDGMRGLRQCWAPALVAGAAFGLAQFVTSNYISVELTDIVASLVAVAALVGFTRIWQPSELVSMTGARPAMAGGATHDPAFERRMQGGPGGKDDGKDVLLAFAPYLIIIAVFAIAQGPLKDTLAETNQAFQWPGLDVINPAGEPASAVTYTWTWLSSAGTLLLISGLITMAVLRIGFGTAIKAFVETVTTLKFAILTVMAVLALAYVMNLSGQTITLGRWLSGAGDFFAFLSPIIGWLGVAVTGSDTSSNALFGALQVQAASGVRADEILFAASNSSGGVMGKMISPQNLAIGAAAVGLVGREGDLFRKVLPWSLGFLLFMSILVYLQSTAVLGWMVP